MKLENLLKIKMNLKLKKQQIVGLLILVGLLIILPAALILVKQSQELRKEAVGTREVKFTLVPASGEKTKGSEFTVEVKLNSQAGGQQILTAGADLTFPTAALEVSNVQCGTNFPMTAAANVSGNKIYLSCGRQPPALTLVAGTPVVLGTFKVKVKAETTETAALIGFVRTLITAGPTDFSDEGTGATYTIIPVPTPTPTEGLVSPTPTPTEGLVSPTPTPTEGLVSPTPTPTRIATATPTRIATATPTRIATATPTGAVTATPTPTSVPGQVKFRFQIKFAGVDTEKPDQKVHVEVKSGLGESSLAIYDNVNVSAINTSTDPSKPNWVYESEIITLPPYFDTHGGYNAYYLTIKGPKHLATRYCESVSQKRPCDVPQTKMSGLCLGIVCYSEPVTFVFTGYSLPAGDLPLPQDGVVNSLDAVALTTCFATPDAQVCLNKADLNLDGIINTLDMELMNQTIYSRWEDQ